MVDLSIDCRIRDYSKRIVERYVLAVWRVLDLILLMDDMVVLYVLVIL